MDQNVLGLAGKPALVIGGGFGMGKASALLLARAGANVALADIVEERAHAAAKEVQALGVRSLALTGDVTDMAQAHRIVAEAVKFHGGLEVLINMVGLATWNELMDTEEAAWEQQMMINLRHHVYIGRAAARQMIQQGTGGRMAFVASVSGIYGAPYHGAYGAAKAGLMSLTRTMANEWGKHNIRVNAVAPDVISTPRHPGSMNREQALDEGVLLGRMGQPEEIAGALVFFVSDLASFVTGQTLIVDGGVHAAFPHFRGVAAAFERSKRG
ncbi:MAG TPA: SDR family oxidoreductase [Candidatus Binataceae bacterium]|jgi:NAD(P)-dependent dehydrogenase (short-subunit alcohol dehydrogenase family)|nr:SDR family oxidoreductase [Candidatus Binataceae bacterium]